MRKVLDILIWIILAGAVLLLPAFAARERKEIPCQGTAISLKASADAPLLSTEDLERFLLGKFDTLKGKPLISINTEAAESWLKENPYVLDAQAYLDMDNTLLLSVNQEQPLLKIYRPTGGSAYLSRSGRLMPVKEGVALRIPLVSGFLGELPAPGKHIDPARHTRLEAAYQLGLRMEKDEFLQKLVSQVYIESNGDLRLEPRIGQHSILLGDTTALDHKLENLQAFYRQGLVRGPWDRYELINLKYKDQVVCIKRKSYEII